MTRFLAWFRFEWRDHWKLVAGCTLGTIVIMWAVILAARFDMDREALESMGVAAVTLIGIVVGAGLFGAERRHGSESLVQRLPGSRAPLFLARLAFFATALGSVALVTSFAAARLATIHHLPVVRMGDVPLDVWFVTPRWMVADMAVLGLAFASVALLASAWTRRVALALFVGLFVPVVLCLPLLYLGAARQDFYDFRLLGAVPLAAWPLLGLALAALTVCWFCGRRFLNQPRRAFALGLLVLFVGGGVAAGWTANAFATFDDVNVSQPGFRMSALTSGRGSSSQQWGAALGEGGRFAYVQGYRWDRGTWPTRGRDNYGETARDFRADRGTYSRQWKIDMQTGQATPLGAVRSAFTHPSLGAGGARHFAHVAYHQARLNPKRHVVLGGGSMWDDQMVDLAAGTIVGLPLETWDAAVLEQNARLVAPSRATAITADGRPAWLALSFEPESSTHSLFIMTPDGEREVPYQTGSWEPIPGGWALWRYPARGELLTLDASTGRIRKLEDSAARSAVVITTAAPIYLGLSQVLIADDSAGSFRVLDLDTDTLGDPRRGPLQTRIMRPALPDGRVLIVGAGDAGDHRFVVWDPVFDTRMPVTAPEIVGLGVNAPLPVGNDWRGNAVLLHNGDRVPVKGEDGTIVGTPWKPAAYFYRHATKTIHLLRPQASFQIEVVGIDEEDRVVFLDGAEDRGFTRLVRFDPDTGEEEVVFPR